MLTKREGIDGENAACAYLRAKGYRVLARNFIARGGEIDIVAADGETLVFVEVKARKDNCFGDPLESVTPQKVKRIVLGAKQYIAKNGLYGRDVRFDIVGILHGSITHVTAAFDAN